MSNTKSIIANRAHFNALCAASGATSLVINFGLIASERFNDEAQSHVLSANPNTVELLKIPQIVSEILQDMAKIGYSVDAYRVADSKTEPTIVMIASHKNAKITYHELNKLSSKYAQDCIALSNGTDGILLGEYNNLWGEFSFDYFIK